MLVYLCCLGFSVKYHDDYLYEKKRKKEWNKEHAAGGFRCAHCRVWVTINDYIGTKNRNHCNYCLWSKHVDIKKGDRKESCHGGMRPAGLTFKQEGYGRQGELMLIHQCATCEKVSINRIAADDDNEAVMDLFRLSCRISGELARRLCHASINWLHPEDENEVYTQLFGNRY